MKTRLTVVTAALAVGVLSFNCGTMMTPDAGSGGGTGGGATGGGTGGGTTGGGTTGGGGATGGGTTRQCGVAPTFLATDLAGGPGYDPGVPMQYPPLNFVLFGKASDAGVGRFDTNGFEFYTNAPYNMAMPALNYQQCDICILLSFGCDNMGRNCTKDYLAQAGQISVAEATKNVDAGTFTFNLTNIVYEEWDFMADRATDGGCLTQAALSYTGSWP